MIPYSRAKRSDLYTLSYSKLLENHTLHSGTYLYSPYMAVPPPPPGDLSPGLQEIALACATDRGDAAKIKQATLPSPSAFFSYHFLYHDCTANVEPSITTTAIDGNFVNSGRKVNGESLWKLQSKNFYNFLNWIHKMGSCLNLMF